MLGERRQSLRATIVAQPETDVETLAGKPQPHGNTQINRNGLNSDVSVSQ